MHGTFVVAYRATSVSVSRKGKILPEHPVPWNVPHRRVDRSVLQWIDGIEIAVEVPVASNVQQRRHLVRHFLPDTIKREFLESHSLG